MEMMMMNNFNTFGSVIVWGRDNVIAWKCDCVIVWGLCSIGECGGVIA